MRVYIFNSAGLVKMYEAEHAILPTISGLVGVFDNHTTLVTGIEPGLLAIKEKTGTWTSVVVLSGVGLVKKNHTFIPVDIKKDYVFSADPQIEKGLQPLPNTTCVIILVKGVEFSDTINADQALAAYTEAQTKLANATTKKERIIAKEGEKVTRARYKATKEAIYSI